MKKGAQYVVPPTMRGKGLVVTQAPVCTVCCGGIPLCVAEGLKFEDLALAYGRTSPSSKLHESQAPGCRDPSTSQLFPRGSIAQIPIRHIGALHTPVYVSTLDP